jgi:uncharacterized membrane protein YhaH (DUF805 family)
MVTYLVSLFFKPSGTIGRIEYLLGHLSLVVPAVCWYWVTGLVPGSEHPNNYELLVVSTSGLAMVAFVIYASITMNIKRFREFGLPRLWPICMVPYLNFIVLIFLSIFHDKGQLTGKSWEGKQ